MNRFVSMLIVFAALSGGIAQAEPCPSLPNADLKDMTPKELKDLSKKYFSSGEYLITTTAAMPRPRPENAGDLAMVGKACIEESERIDRVVRTLEANEQKDTKKRK